MITRDTNRARGDTGTSFFVRLAAFVIAALVVLGVIAFSITQAYAVEAAAEVGVGVAYTDDHFAMIKAGSEHVKAFVVGWQGRRPNLGVGFGIEDSKGRLHFGLDLVYLKNKTERNCTHANFMPWIGWRFGEVLVRYRHESNGDEFFGDGDCWGRSERRYNENLGEDFITVELPFNLLR